MHAGCNRSGVPGRLIGEIFLQLSVVRVLVEVTGVGIGGITSAVGVVTLSYACSW